MKVLPLILAFGLVGAVTAETDPRKILIEGSGEVITVTSVPDKKPTPMESFQEVLQDGNVNFVVMPYGKDTFIVGVFGDHDVKELCQTANQHPNANIEVVYNASGGESQECDQL